jgi:hypothetical protein
VDVPARAGQVVVDHDRAGRQDLELVAGRRLGDVVLPGRLAGRRVDADDVVTGSAGGDRHSAVAGGGQLLEDTGSGRREGPPLSTGLSAHPGDPAVGQHDRLARGNG